MRAVIVLSVLVGVFGLALAVPASAAERGLERAFGATGKPRIVAERFKWVSQGSAGTFKLFRQVRFRVCGGDFERDSLFLVQIAEISVIGRDTKGRPFVRATGLSTVSRAGKNTRCKSYKVRWRIKDKFVGISRYTIALTVLDDSHRWSNTIRRTTYTTD